MLLHSPFYGLPQSFAGRGLGWHPSPPRAPHETPDATLKAGPIVLPTTAPPSADASRLVLGVLMQFALGACTANATAQAERASHVRQLLALGITMEAIHHQPPSLLSRLMLYWLARARMGQTASDTGTFIRLIFEVLNEYGFTPERDWPYVVDDLNSANPTFTRRPSTKVFEDAWDQRQPTAYVRIDTDGDQRVEDIKRAIASDYLVVFGTPVTQAFCTENFDATKPIPRPGPNDVIAGGHAMCAAKYSADGLGIVNSWDTGFALNGWCTFGWEYVTWDQFADIWIVEAAPLYAPDIEVAA
jgi:hypothetical protein